jgi:16S rRNA (guanine527-N7)-methyltransferase
MDNNASEMTGYLKQAVGAMKIGVSEYQYGLFQQYCDFLLEYNRKINLTRITDPLEVAVKHFADSLSLLETKKFPPGCSVVDVGSGAGFPGIPIAIMRPDIKMTLVDSLRKRTVFLSETVRLLELDNVQVLWSRAEEVGHNPLYRERFDIALARAVAPLNVLVELCLPLLKQGGFFLAMKGLKADEELSQALGAIGKLGGYFVSIVKQPLPLVEEVRSLILIGKNMPTSALYPRKPGIPERQPLT